MIIQSKSVELNSKLYALNCISNSSKLSRSQKNRNREAKDGAVLAGIFEDLRDSHGESAWINRIKQLISKLE